MTPATTLGRRTLGVTSPLDVSALGLGCMGMSEFYGTGDEQQGIDTVRRALDLGVTFLDTADMYGPFTNERLVGAAIAGRRDEVELATKFGNERAEDGTRLGINGRPEYVRAACDASLAAARRRPHRPLLPAPRRPVGADRGDRRRHGRARRGRQGPPPRAVRGVGGHDPPGPRRAPDHRPPDRVLASSPATSRTRSCPTIRELGIGLVPYSPLGRGLLTGAITSETTLEDGDSRRTAYFPRFRGEALDANLALVARVREHGRRPRRDAGPAGAGVGAGPGRRRGARSRAPSGSPYLEENVGAAAVALTAEDLAALAEAVPRDAVAGARYGDMSSIDR